MLAARLIRGLVDQPRLLAGGTEVDRRRVAVEPDVEGAARKCVVQVRPVREREGLDVGDAEGLERLEQQTLGEGVALGPAPLTGADVADPQREGLRRLVRLGRTATPVVGGAVVRGGGSVVAAGREGTGGEEEEGEQGEDAPQGGTSGSGGSGGEGGVGTGTFGFSRRGRRRGGRGAGGGGRRSVGRRPGAGGGGRRRPRERCGPPRGRAPGRPAGRLRRRRG